MNFQLNDDEIWRQIWRHFDPHLGVRMEKTLMSSTHHVLQHQEDGAKQDEKGKKKQRQFITPFVMAHFSLTRLFLCTQWFQVLILLMNCIQAFISNME